MSSQIRIVRGVMCSVLLLVATFALIQSVSGEPGLSGKALLGNKCILCNSFPANHTPRICNNCNSKFNNKCILCNSFPANHAPRICNNCNSKFNNKCILCNSFPANHAPRICNNCNSKH